MTSSSTKMLVNKQFNIVSMDKKENNYCKWKDNNERPTTAAYRSSMKMNSYSPNTKSEPFIRIEKPEYDLNDLIKKSSCSDRLLSILISEDENIKSKLLLSCDAGNWRGVYAILHQGIQIDSCIGMNGFRPLHYACNRGHLEVARILLQAGCQVNHENNDGETALHLAAYRGNINVVELLLDKGADINALTKDEETALFYAVRKGYSTMVNFLIRRGARNDQVNRFGEKPLDETQDKRIHQILLSMQTVSQDNLILGQDEIKSICKFLDVKCLCRVSRISSRWHRASQEPSIWQDLGVRRHEMLFQASVGLGFVAPMLGFRITNGTISSRPATSERDFTISRRMNSEYRSLVRSHPIHTVRTRPRTALSSNC